MIHNHEVGGSSPPRATKSLHFREGSFCKNASLMFYFYVLYSLKDGRLYKGSTSDLPKRVLQHNAGRTPSTKHRRPFILLYFEPFEQKAEASARERWAKSLEGGAALRQLLVEKSLLALDGKINDQCSAG